jgi:hypothetical protein
VAVAVSIFVSMVAMVTTGSAIVAVEVSEVFGVGVTPCSVAGSSA